MDKREVIHALIDKLLDIDESDTKKQLNFYFIKLEDGGSCFDFNFREGNGSSDSVLPRVNLYFGNNLESEKKIHDAFEVIEAIKNTPDIEPKINLSISQSRARELGLIS